MYDTLSEAAHQTTSQSSAQIMCCYVNTTNVLQIIRITNVPHWYFERVVFPGQRLVFYGFHDAWLDIHTPECAVSILKRRILCQDLAVEELDIDTGVVPMGMVV